MKLQTLSCSQDQVRLRVLYVYFVRRKSPFPGCVLQYVPGDGRTTHVHTPYIHMWVLIGLRRTLSHIFKWVLVLNQSETRSASLSLAGPQLLDRTSPNSCSAQGECQCRGFDKVRDSLLDRTRTPSFPCDEPFWLISTLRAFCCRACDLIKVQLGSFPRPVMIILKRDRIKSSSP
jgi:hypothetical protein